MAVAEVEVGKLETPQSFQVTEKAQLSERVRRVKASFFEELLKPSLERTKIQTEIYKAHGDKGPNVLRALVFSEYLKKMTIWIDDNMIVGSMTQYRRGCTPTVEYFAGNPTRKRSTAYGEYVYTDEETKIYDEALEYWKPRSQWTKCNEIWTRRTGWKLMEDWRAEPMCQGSFGTPLGFTLPDYYRTLGKGVNDIIAEATERRDALEWTDPDVHKKIDFYDGVIISCEGVIAWANRYGELAEKMAADPAQAWRKEELLQLAETCRRVPAQPARTFREAMQSVYFVHMAGWIENNFAANGFGRMTKYLWPFYKADKEAGRITDDEVVELFEMMMIKTAEVNAMLADSHSVMMQNHTGQVVTLGGFDEHGKWYSESTELDYLYLEAEKQVRMLQPSTVVAWTKDIPDEYMAKALETVKIGLGKPAFINAHVAFDRHWLRWGEYGLTLDQAYDVACAGCIQTQPSSSADGKWGSSINLGLTLWLALCDGVSPKSGKQLGLHTGFAKDCKSIEDVKDKFYAQLAHLVPLFRTIAHVAENYDATYLPTPWISAVTRGCLEAGKDVNGGGALFENDCDSLIGGVDTANSLYAIKKVVFDDKFCTMEELMEALKANFEGSERNEAIHQACLAAPKYGNDIDEVDAYVFELYDKYADIMDTCKTALGNRRGKAVGSGVTISSTSHYGMASPALPDGRKKGIPYADGSNSPEPGTDVNGPTAAIKSMAKAFPFVRYSTNIGNMKFHPTALATRESRRRLADLIRTYMDLGGFHIQFQVVDTATLRDAQRRPTVYKDLVVRVAGYSAFFVTLVKDTQEEIIGRNENTWRN